MGADGSIDLNFFLLPACVEIARSRGRGPEIPKELHDGYFEALARLPACALRHMNNVWGADMTKSALAAIAVAKGQIDLAELLVELDEETLKKLVTGEVRRG